MALVPTVPSFNGTPAPIQSCNVKVLFRVVGDGSGVIGDADSGIWYQISLDGGVTYTAAAALVDASGMTMPEALGDVELVFTEGSGASVADEDYITFSTTVIANGTVGDPLLSSDLTDKVAASGTPDDDYEILVDFTVGGVTGVAGICYRYSRDNGRTGMSAPRALGTSSTITIPNTGGVVLTFDGSTTITAGTSQINVNTSAPGCTLSDLQDGLDMVPDYTGDWEMLQVVGGEGTSATVAQAVHTLLAGMPDTNAKDRYGMVGFRRPLDSETAEATYQAQVAIWRGNVTSALGYVAGAVGSCQVVTSGCSYRRDASFAVGAKQASVPEQVNIAQRQAPGGALPAVTLGRNPVSGLADHDEYINPGLDDLGVITLRTWTDLTGVYVTWPHTLAARGSDFWEIPRRRVMNRALTAARTYSANLTAKNLYIDTATGFLATFERARLDSGASSAVWQEVKGRCSGSAVVYAPDDNLLTNPPGPLNATVNIVPFGEVHDTAITAQFSATIQS